MAMCQAGKDLNYLKSRKFSGMRESCYPSCRSDSPPASTVNPSLAIRGKPFSFTYFIISHVAGFVSIRVNGFVLWLSVAILKSNSKIALV